MSRRASTLVLLVTAMLVGACAAPKRHPVPPEHVSAAGIPGVRLARFTGDKDAEIYADERLESWVSQGTASGIIEKPQRYLAISGGGANGAFGAGLLVGWTAAGTRPEFQHVTGISTGALIAPFAFLGPEYDDRMQELYTTTSTKDILRKRGLIAALTSDAFADTAPLRRLIAQCITDEMIDEIAGQHLRGRRLIIGTTNLDIMKSCYWSVSAIAASDHAGRYMLVRDILLASASIPGAFPPVLFEVEVEGEIYDELHVDGGASTQVFSYPLTIDIGAIFEDLGVSTDRKLFIIRNSRLEPKWKSIDRAVFAIAGRSIDALIRTQGVGDLYRIFLGTLRDRIDFNLAYIPGDFDVEATEAFDPVYMSQLFERGKEMAINGYPWEPTPPDWDWDWVKRTDE